MLQTMTCVLYQCREDFHPVQVKKRKTELAQFETVDCGKPIVEAEADMVRLHICQATSSE